MSTSPPNRKPARKPAVPDRRAPAGAKGTATRLRQFKGMLGRPLGLERRDGAVHVVLVDRRHTPNADQPPTVKQLCADLRARLLAHDMHQAAQLMRHLVCVHDELGRKGWTGVGALPASVLRLALVQADMLADGDTAPPLSLFIDQLRLLQVAAELREERQSRLKGLEASSTVEVSETTQEDFEAMERSWLGTVPPHEAPGNGK